MEIVLEIIRETVSGGFWHFAGCWLVIALFAKVLLAPFNFLKKAVNNMRKNKSGGINENVHNV